MWPAPHGLVDYLPCIVENERGCKFLTASSNVQGSFRVFIDEEDFIMKIICKMTLELWSAVLYTTSIWKQFHRQVKQILKSSV